MTEIAKDYGISDNALRKWCQKLGVKYRKLELNPNYTNIKICPICGKKFKADSQSRKFCSKECVNNHNNKRPLDNELILMFSSNKKINELAKEYNVCIKTIST
jgi:predicted nucleic acid-binding Zn ribbon protein